MNFPSTTIVLTNSRDVTTDVLFRHLPSDSDKIFRFNFDLFDEYEFCLDGNGFSITDPLGRIANSQNIKKAYFRKPSKPRITNAHDGYLSSEKWSFYKELIYQLWSKNKIVLVEPETQVRRIGKVQELQIATRFFNVPETVLTNKIEKHLPSWEKSVVKSLSGEFVENKRLFTTLVKPENLDNLYPWFLQEYIEAKYDLTVVYVREKLFAFRLLRDFLNTSVDCRAPNEKELWDKWEFFELDDLLRQSIISFMKLLRLNYGRLDFLIKHDGKVIFCEVNPNGQFAWLDLENKNNLLGTIADEISPDTDVNPIPYNPFVY